MRSVVFFVWAVLALTPGAKPLMAKPLMNKPPKAKLENLVGFGDSYSEEGRLEYFLKNHRPPPVGIMMPPSKKTYSGGYAWGRLVARKTGARYYNYAVSGAMCSNSIVARRLEATGGPYPSVLEYEMETYRQEIGNRSLYPDRRPENTLYALWIGTNDLGVAGFLTDRQEKGAQLGTFVDCVWAVLDGIYNSGGRRIVLINQAPLQLAPMYAAPGRWGAGNREYIRLGAGYNKTAYQYKLEAYTTSVNTMFAYGAPFQLLVQRRWPGTELSILDLHTLMRRIWEQPADYLDRPANATAPYLACAPGCVEATEPLSSFLW